MSKGNRFVVGLISGAVIGAAAGLLLAPKTGEETRHIVAERATQAKQKAGDFVGTLRQRVRQDKAPQGTEETSENHTGITGT